jgi:hypothetical protein
LLAFVLVMQGAVALLAPASAAAGALAGGDGSAGAVTLRLAFVPGSVRRYAITMAMTAQLPEGEPTAMDMEMQLAYRVVQVHPDRSATVTATIERMAALLGRDPLPVPDMSGLVTQMRLYPNGRVTEVSVDPGALSQLGQLGQLGSLTLPGLPGQGGQGSLAGFGQGITGFEYPDHPIRVGETFERQVSLDLAGLGFPGLGTPAAPGAPGPGASPLAAQSRTTLDGVATIGGRRVARFSDVSTVDLTFSPPAPPSAPDLDVSISTMMESRSTQLVDAASGWPESSEGTLRGTVSLTLPEQPGGSPPGAAGRSSVPGLAGPLTMNLVMRMTMRRL